MIENLLLLLPITILIGVPVYIFFREKMVHDPKTTTSHHAKRVFKLTGINLSLNSLATIYFFTLFILTVFKLGDNLDFKELFLSIFFMLSIGITFYGDGIYITSIVLEDYTLPELRFKKEFKTQFIATHLFHGPISHILIYTGWLFIFLALSLLDLSGLPVMSLSVQLWLILGGFLVGLLYAKAQIYNGSAPYQLISGFIAFCIFALFSFFSNTNLWFHPLGIFFFSLVCSFDFILLIYVFGYKLKNHSINWDGSGY